MIFEIKDGKGFIIEYSGNFELIFTGNYLNGERSGSGKEYYKGILQFEGEYFNGKRNGKGKEYSENNKIEYEGEYLNGIMWNGIRYDECGGIFEINNGIVKRK